MDAGFDARLRSSGVAFDDRDATLLRAIDSHGSLSGAADALGRSYARSHTRLTELEDAFGSLVERTRGGADGGGSRLTENARDLLARFDRLQAGYHAIATVREAVLHGTVASRDGELGVVETGAGSVRALVPPDAESVTLSVRADAVTLHAPADSPEPDATSARNRFPATVTAVDRGEAVVAVTLDCGGETLYALVTADSADRLDLAAGVDVVASFKATATHATRAE